MFEFPSAPQAPNEFFEGFLGRALARVPRPQGLPDALGVVLRGAQGGEWTLHLADGAPRVVPGSAAGVAFRWVQSVEDWRGALWEGRGGSAGRWAALVFDPLRLAALATERAPLGPPPAGLAKLASFSGLFELRITDAPGGAWAAGLMLGDGPLPEAPNASVTLADEDAEALSNGSLAPVEAFLAGRVRVEGDAALLLKLPGLALAAAGF